METLTWWKFLVQRFFIKFTETYKVAEGICGFFSRVRSNLANLARGYRTVVTANRNNLQWVPLKLSPDGAGKLNFSYSSTLNHLNRSVL